MLDERGTKLLEAYGKVSICHECGDYQIPVLSTLRKRYHKVMIKLHHFPKSSCINSQCKSGSYSMKDLKKYLSQAKELHERTGRISFDCKKFSSK
ncbi:hypothetical protein SMD22_00185 (plasmid) [Brevibacillus halotolerans]|nr:hypothetical protein SMD22_00185 [Brevibacillus halotolerans]